MDWLTVYGIWLAFLAIYSAGTYVVARVFSVGIAEVGICFGPTIFKSKWNGVEFYFKLIPLGSYVRLKTTVQEGDFDEDAVQKINDLPGLRYDEIHWFKRILVILSGPLSYLIFSAIILGVSDVWNSASVSFGEVGALVSSPSTNGRDEIAKAVEYLKADPFSAIAAFAAKLAVINLLPIPGLNGWFLWMMPFISSKRNKYMEAMQYCGLFVVLFMFVQLGRGIYFYLRS